MTPSGIEPATFGLVAQCLINCATVYRGTSSHSLTRQFVPCMVAPLEVSGLMCFTYWIIDFCCYWSSSISIDVWGYRCSSDWSPDVIPFVLLQEDVTSTGCRFHKTFRHVRSRCCRHLICVISDPERGVQFSTGQQIFLFSRTFHFSVFGSAQSPIQ